MACANCKQKRGTGDETVSMVIVSCCEGENLVKTCQSIKLAEPKLHQLIVVDDASEPPEEFSTVRNKERTGVAGSRHIGCQAATGGVVGLCDAHMEFKTGMISDMARVAMRTGAIVYAGCNGHHLAGLRWEGGILRGKWRPTRRYREEGKRFVRTSAIMGAFYFVRKDVLEKMGGWVYLPGWWGMDEEAMSVLAAMHGVPIIADIETQTWHLFRGQGGNPIPVPYALPLDRYLVNIAGMYRILFGDETWGRMKPVLRDLILDEVYRPVPDYLIQEVEGPAWVAYGKALRERFVLPEETFFTDLAETIQQEKTYDEN